jgi:hypothetical protein
LACVHSHEACLQAYKKLQRRVENGYVSYDAPRGDRRLKERGRTSSVFMTVVHCGWHSFEMLDGSIPERAFKRCRAARSACDSLARAIVTRCAAIKTRKRVLFIANGLGYRCDALVKTWVRGKLFKQNYQAVFFSRTLRRPSLYSSHNNGRG